MTPTRSPARRCPRPPFPPSVGRTAAARARATPNASRVDMGSARKCSPPLRRLFTLPGACLDEPSTDRRRVPADDAASVGAAIAFALARCGARLAPAAGLAASTCARRDTPVECPRRDPRGPTRRRTGGRCPRMAAAPAPPTRLQSAGRARGRPTGGSGATSCLGLRLRRAPRRGTAAGVGSTVWRGCASTRIGSGVAICGGGVVLWNGRVEVLSRGGCTSIHRAQPILGGLCLSPVCTVHAVPAWGRAEWSFFMHFGYLLPPSCSGQACRGSWRPPPRSGW